MNIYLLFYSTDYGEREDWNTFYTPVEAFSSVELRDDRMVDLKKRDPDLNFHTLDVVLDSTEN